MNVSKIEREKCSTVFDFPDEADIDSSSEVSALVLTESVRL